MHGGYIFLICFGGYVVVAAILVRVVPFGWTREAKIRKLQKRFRYSVNNIAHRGGSLIGPENTLFTFHRAIDEAKADMLEMDVNESLDGEIVVSHDPTLGRICGDGYEEKHVKDLVVDGNPSVNLPQLGRVIPLHFKSPQRGDAYLAESQTTSVPVNDCTRLCLLSEVFEQFPSTPIHLDIKSVGDDFTGRVIDMIERYRRESYTFIGTSSPKNRSSLYKYVGMRKARCQPCAGNSSRNYTSVPSDTPESLPSDPDRPLRDDDEGGVRKRSRFRTFASPFDFLIVYLSFYLGLLPLIPLRFDVLSTPVFTQCKSRQLSDMTNCCITHVLTFLFNSPVLWNHLQRRGILVVGWVLNEDEEFVEVADWPLNGIMTDDPIALRDYLATNYQSLTSMNLLA